MSIYDKDGHLPLMAIDYSRLTFPTFTHIRVDDLSIVLGCHDRPIYNTCNWCNGIALYLVTRTSYASGNVYQDYACDEHANKWREGISEFSGAVYVQPELL